MQRSTQLEMGCINCSSIGKREISYVSRYGSATHHRRCITCGLNIVKESIPSYPGTANARSVLEPLVVVHMSHPSFGIWDIQDTLKDFKNDHPNPTHNTSKMQLRTFQTGLTMSQVEMANLMANNLLIEDSPAPTPNSSITDSSLSHCEFGEYCNGIIREAGVKVR